MGEVASEHKVDGSKGAAADEVIASLADQRRSLGVVGCAEALLAFFSQPLRAVMSSKKKNAKQSCHSGTLAVRSQMEVTCLFRLLSDPKPHQTSGPISIGR